MQFAGTVSRFEGEIRPTREGHFRLRVIATQPEEANTGMHERAIVVIHP